ncbi:hypothetical protein [uncultured Chitinophaga sp.]|jgi:hypothetical protein|uniref:hypothetical protein n=1 Tax=uncultured Chitinophaga sp. TaxID=339340 RepID=UPI002605B8B3|nr:hypothetical protein [uncultured Chitinophaga sp.]
MNTLLRLINAVRKLSEEDKACIAGFIKTAEIPSGEIWSAASKQCIGCLEKGLVLKTIRVKRNRVVIGIHKDGDGFPLGTARTSFRFTAVEPAVIHYIKYEDIRLLYRRFSVLIGFVNKLMQRDLHQMRFYTSLGDEPDPLQRCQLYLRRHPLYAARLPTSVLARVLEVSEKMIAAVGRKRRLVHN